MKLLQVQAPAEGQSTADSFLRNKDLLPVEPERRVWHTWSFVSFWIADSLNINTLMIASTAVASGLPWWSAWIAIIIGYSLVGLLVAAMAHIAAIYHISFPILARSSFGVWGALWPALNRVVTAMLWTGVQGWIGSQLVTLVLQSMAPNYVKIPNSMPASSGTETYMFLSFFLFSLIQLPIVLISPEKIRFFFYVKATVVPIAILAFFAWSIADANGLGPIIHQSTTISGSEYGWQFMTALMNCLSNFATLVVNIPDVARLAKNTKSVRWSQILSIPICFGITSFIGIIVASSSKPVYGEVIWNPVDLLGERLKRDPSAGDRAGVFFISLALIVGQIGTNVSANTLAAGHDLAAMVPRFISIRRGSLLCAIVGFAMCPWHLLSSSSSFSTYLSAYSLFLSSIAGTMFCDFYFVRRGHLRVPDLYTASKTGAYRYVYGFNLRGFAAYIAGIAICVTGFAGVLGAQVSQAARHMYIIAYPLGLLVAMLVYLVLCTIWPVEDAVNVTKDRTTWLAPASYEEDGWWPEHGHSSVPDLKATDSITPGSDAGDGKQSPAAADSEKGQIISSTAY